MQMKFLLVLTAFVALAYAATEPLDLIAEESQDEPTFVEAEPSSETHLRPKRTILLKKAALIGGAGLIAGKVLLAKKALLLGAGVGGAALLGAGLYRAGQNRASSYANGYGYAPSNNYVYVPVPVRNEYQGNYAGGYTGYHAPNYYPASNGAASSASYSSSSGYSY